MSIQSPVGTLDIKNATLRVGKLEVSNIQGVDTALNVTRANSVLIYDDQASTTTFTGFTSSVDVRDTGNGYIDLAQGYVYWGQKLPNAWVMDFEMDIRSGTNAGPLYANVFSTTNTGGDGYSFTFNDSNDKISLYYDSTLLTETTVSGLFTASEDSQKVVINFERGLIGISLAGSRKFYYKDIERETHYVNGEYVSFSSASTDGRKIRDLRIVNGEKWVYSGESNVVYTQGSVGIGVTDPTVALDVSGTVKATAFDGDGSAITNISSANVGDFASNVVRIENLETSNGHIWSSLASNVTILRGEIDSNLATARTDLQSNVTILRDEIDSNLATARTDLQSNVTILRDEIDSNLATARTDLQSNVTILRDEIDSNLATARTDLQSNVTILRDEIDSNLATARTDLQSNVTILRDTAITFMGTKTFQDDVVLESNLRVQGDLLVANTVNMTVSDPILELGSNNLNTGDVGIVMTRHGASNSNVAIFFDETADTLKLGYTLNGAGDSTLEFDSNALAVSVQGALTATSVSGNGSGLTSLNATNISSGTINKDRLPTTLNNTTIESAGHGTLTISDSSGDNQSITKYTTTSFNWTTGIHGQGGSGGEYKIANGGDLATNTRVTIDTAGQVGIATDSPAYKLDVHGTSNVGALTTTSVSGNGSGLTSLNAGNLASGTVPSARLSLTASDIPNLSASKITSGTLTRPISTTTGTFSGDVGIGTTSPTDLLDVHYPTPSYGSSVGTEEGSLTVSSGAEHSNAAVYFRTPFNAAAPAKMAIFSSGGGHSGANGGGLHFCLENTNNNTTKVDLNNSKMVVKADGKVGIATTSPAYTLDVHGTSNVGALTTTSVSGDGSSLTSLNADNLSSGTVPSARLSLAASDIPDLSASKITSGTLGRPISTTTGTFSGLLTASGGVRSYKDGVVAEFQQATSGEYTLINFHYKVNSGSDRGFILVQDESATSPGAGSEDLRMTIGVHNDFRSSASHSDELWFQGGGRLVYNVGSWDSELDTIIGTPGVGTTGGHEWRVNNSTKVVINHSGNVGIGTTSPGSLLTIESTTGNQMRLNYNADWYNIIERDSSGDLNFLEKAGASASLKNLMTIKTGGNVGIGNTNPAFPLSIGTSDGNKILFNQSGTTPGHNITCSSGWQWNFNAARSGQDDDAKITFNISGSSGYDEIMRVNSTGVGIGTTSPSAKLHIGPNNDDHIYLASANNAYGWKIDTDDQGSGEVPFRIIKRLGGSDATALTIKNQNGNVGIGTTSPATKLDVAGVGRFTSNGGSVQLVGTDHTYLEYYPDGTSAGRKAYVGYASATDNNFNISNSAGSGHIILGFGNVGIGETSPSYKLDVNGETRVGNVLYIGKNTDDETAKTIYFGGTAGDNAYDHCVIERRVWSTGTEKQELLLFSGNDPETTAGPDRIRLKGAQILFDTYTGASTDRAAESTRMIIRANGWVGIGTASPGKTLDVNGVLRSRYTAGRLSGTFDTSGLNIGDFAESTSAMPQIGWEIHLSFSVSTEGANVRIYGAYIPSQVLVGAAEKATILFTEGTSSGWSNQSNGNMYLVSSAYNNNPYYAIIRVHNPIYTNANAGLARHHITSECVGVYTGVGASIWKSVGYVDLGGQNSSDRFNRLRIVTSSGNIRGQWTAFPITT